MENIHFFYIFSIYGQFHFILVDVTDCPFFVVVISNQYVSWHLFAAANVTVAVAAELVFVKVIPVPPAVIFTGLLESE
jgi:hypothetical protein